MSCGELMAGLGWLGLQMSEPELHSLVRGLDADGDEEDLEEAELRDALRLHAARAAPKQRRAKPAARRTAAPPLTLRGRVLQRRRNGVSVAP